MKNSNTNFKIFFILILFFCLNNLHAVYKKTYDYDKLIESLPSNIQVIKTKKEITVLPEKYDSILIFYPGALVEFDSYLPLMIECGKNNIKCIIVKMPRNYAFYGINKADRYYKLEQNATEKKWFIGGHSLGGAIAGFYVSKTSGKYEGLILMAAYTDKKIKDENLKCLSIYGSEDKVLKMTAYEKYKANLPVGYCEVIIEGGNHAGFGVYGNQKGDGNILIKPEQQISITAEEISKFCRK